MLALNLHSLGHTNLIGVHELNGPIIISILKFPLEPEYEDEYFPGVNIHNSAELRLRQQLQNSLLFRTLIWTSSVSGFLPSQKFFYEHLVHLFMSTSNHLQ